MGTSKYAARFAKVPRGGRGSISLGIVFVGPTAAAMKALGGKAAAKEIAIKAGVPVVPGYQGAAQDLKTLKAEDYFCVGLSSASSAIFPATTAQTNRWIHI